MKNITERTGEQLETVPNINGRKAKTEREDRLKKKIQEGNKSATFANPVPSGPVRERSPFRRRTSRKKGKKIIPTGDAPTTGAALDEGWDASQFKVPPG